MRVGPQKDSGDVKDGWVAMACFGNFTGGGLCAPALWIKIPFRPGDIVFFRSSLLEHWVEEFEGGRFSVVLFTKPDG